MDFVVTSNCTASEMSTPAALFRRTRSCRPVRSIDRCGVGGAVRESGGHRLAFRAFFWHYVGSEQRDNSAVVQAISSSGIRLMYVSRVWIYKNKLDPSKDLGQISLVLSMVNLGHVQIRPTHVYFLLHLYLPCFQNSNQSSSTILSKKLIFKPTCLVLDWPLNRKVELKTLVGVPHVWFWIG